MNELQNKALNEAPQVTLDADDMINPANINLKDMAQRAVEKEIAEKEAAEKQAKLDKFREEHKDLIEKVEQVLNANKDVETTIDELFELLVPSSGAAETVAGELVRAIMRMLYRDSNDGDKFFMGYGIETCGGSAQYLLDQGFDRIDAMLDDALRLADDDDLYTKELMSVAEEIIEKIKETPELLLTENKEDSRDYDDDHIVESQPRYEIEIPCSDDVIQLVEEGIINSWDLNSYVENMLSYESFYEGAEVCRPWGYQDTSVTVENLTRDGYDHLEESTQRDLDGWWEELVQEHADELNSLEDEVDDEDLDDDYED